nr:hypothetical protein [Tanacetum cinerariifolium]
DYALESAIRILNMVPTNKALVKWDTHDKLQQRSVKCIFIGYPKETVGYYFYFLLENKIVVARYAEFFEKNLISQEVNGRAGKLKEIQDEDTSPSKNTSKIPAEKEHSLMDLNEPTNYKDAMLDPESNKWLDAMNAKMQSIKDNQVWRLVDLPPNCNTVGSKWIFKKNTDMDGIIHTYKAYLVAKGYTQTYVVDYKETFSPVADIRAIRILIVITAFYDYEIWQMDVKIAFLNGYLDVDIYMVQLEGFVDPKHPRKAGGSNVTFLILNIDDIHHEKPYSKFTKCKVIPWKVFLHERLGEATFILGIKIYRDRTNNIPMQERFYLNKTQGASTPEEVKRMKNVPYASAVGSIIRLESFKQSTTKMFATKVEYIASSEAAMEAIWIRKFISGLGIVPTINKPIKMFSDNSAALLIANEPGVQMGTRHYHRRYHYVRECIELCKINLLKVHTYDNLAYPFMKALPKGKLTQRARSMELHLASSYIKPIEAVSDIEGNATVDEKDKESKGDDGYYQEFVGIKRICDDLRVTVAQVQDYALWDVIESNNSFVPVTQTITAKYGATTTTISSPVTAEENIKKKNDVKARSMLLMALLNEHHMTFNQYKDVKSLFTAIETRNKSEQEVKSTASLNSSSQDMAFVSSPSTNSTNDVYDAYGASTASTQSSNATSQTSTANLSDATVYAFLANQLNGSQLIHEDFEQIHEDDLEEIDLKWQLALLSMKAKSGVLQLLQDGHFARECKWPKNQDSINRYQDSSRRTVNMEETLTKAMVAIDGVGFDWSYMAEDEASTNMALMVFSESEFESYRPKSFEKESKNASEDIPNEPKEYLDAPLVKDRVLDNKDCSVESPVVVEKKTDVPTITKVEVVRPKQQEKLVRKTVRLTAITLKWKGWQRPVNTARPRLVNIARPRSVNTARPNSAVVSDGHPQKEYQGYVDSGCSRYMTGTISCLSDFKEFDGGYVTFGGGANYGRITSKGTLKTGILKKFITEIENLVDKKVKVIRCDNGTEFKNSVMNDFCAMKGIRREFSVARTPQQNGVTERKNKILIEAARTMLADFKLPITLWAKAVSTACYVQNRALVVKPHNKTPYELFRGRTHALRFMRPFGCHVIIFNTLDHLGKFDGKAYEGYFVGYFMNSKAFMVYNIRTRRVEENLHVRFLEDKLIIAGARPKWLFDIDMLTKSMNYVPVIVGTKSDDFAGIKDIIGAGQSNMKTGSTQDYIYMPLLKDGSPLFDSYSKISSDAEKKHDEVLDKECRALNKLNSAFENLNTEYPDDLKMPGLETNATYDDSEEEADFTNLESSIHVSPTPTTKTYKNHPVKQGKKTIGTKWVFRKKKDERGIMIKNKARLVAHGHTQEEGIDYDEVFGPVARIEAIRLFLTYASFMGFMVYQMNVKSAFLYGRIEKDVYMCQPPGFEDLDHPYKVYKVVKVLYGLHQAPRAWAANVKFANTLVDTEKTLFKDADGADVDVHLYRSMIGSFMYLTASRPDIMYSVYGLSVFRSRLISWQCKKQTVVATSTTEAEYVAAASCCGKIQALVDKKKVIITETSVRSDLHLEDAKGTECLPIATIFEQLTLIGAKTTAWNKFSSTVASAIICLVTKQNFNFSKYIFDHMVENLEDGVKFLMFPRFVQVFLDSQVEGMLKHKEIYVTLSHTKKIFANIKRQGKDFSGKIIPLFKTMIVQPQEDMGEDSEIPLILITYPLLLNHLHLLNHNRSKSLRSLRKRSLRVLALETTKVDQALEIESLKRKADETQGRNDQDMFDTRILDDEEVVTEEVDDEEVVVGAEKEVSTVDPVSTAGEGVTTAGVEVSTAAITSQIFMDEITLAKALIDIKTSKPKAKGIMIQDPSETPTQTPIDSSQKPSKAKGKRKAKMIEPEKPLKRKDEIMIDEEVAKNLKAQMQAELEEEDGLARQKEEETNIALVVKWDNTQAMIDVDCELAARLQEEEREELTIEEKSRLFVELMGKRKKRFARLRAKKIRKLAEGSKKTTEGCEKAQEDSSKRAADKLEQEDAKRQRIEEENESAELKRCLEIILEDDDDVTIEDTPISSKSPTIVDYKIYKEWRKSFFTIIRADAEICPGELLHNTTAQDTRERPLNESFENDRMASTVVEVLRAYDGDGTLWCDRGHDGGGFGVEVDVVQRLEEKALRDYCCWFDVSAVGSRLMLLGKIDTAAEVTEEIILNSNAHQVSQASNSPEKNMPKRVNIKLGDDGSVVDVTRSSSGSDRMASTMVEVLRVYDGDGMLWCYRGRDGGGFGGWWLLP